MVAAGLKDTLMTERAPITIDVVSDAVCPWCFIGQKRLDLALEAVSDVEVSVSWRPFQLDPTIPAGGVERHAYMAGKFGSMDKVATAHERVREAARDTDIAFDFEGITVAPNTLDAHRVIRWAATSGNDVQNTVVRAIFSAYFEQARDIGDRQVLIDIGTAAGMERPVLETLLAGDADREAVQGEIAMASQMGITGVPCFLLEGRYAVMGAQDAATLADAIRRVSEAKAKGELPQ